MSNDTDFDIWMGQVDMAVHDTVGLSVYDLPDYPFRDAFEDGLDPEGVAEEVLFEAGWEEG